MTSIKEKIRKYEQIWKTDLIVVAVLLGLALVYVIWQPALPSKMDIESWASRLGATGPLALILTVILETVFAPIPGTLISIAAGVVYGIWPGMLYLWIGNIIGSTLSFLIARKLGRPIVRRLIKEKTIARYDAFLQRNRFFIWLVYVVPIFPMDMIGYVIGLSAIPYRRYAVIISAGFAVNLFILTAFGGHIFSAGGGVKIFYALGLAVLLLIAITTEKIITKEPSA